jgi:hypothetical protein
MVEPAVIFEGKPVAAARPVMRDRQISMYIDT